jgi:hypothetical protein
MLISVKVLMHRCKMYPYWYAYCTCAYKHDLYICVWAWRHHAYMNTCTRAIGWLVHNDKTIGLYDKARQSNCFVVADQLQPWQSNQTLWQSTAIWWLRIARYKYRCRCILVYIHVIWMYTNMETDRLDSMTRHGNPIVLFPLLHLHNSAVCHIYTPACRADSKVVCSVAASSYVDVT